MSSEEIIVRPEEEEKRLDKLLVDRFPELSRTYFQRLIENQLVLVNGGVVKKRIMPKAGDEIEIEFTLSEEISLKPEDIPLNIIYEDDFLLAIDKPAGMVVHPAPGNWSKTFANALIFYCQNLQKSQGLRPGIVHRLDKETTGVLIAAKSETMQRKLVELFSMRKMQKEYEAIAVGNPKNVELKGFIGRHPKKRKEMALMDSRGKEAIVSVETKAFDGTLSFVHLFPKTGRTHQLRVQLKGNQTPILGDSTYGNLAMNKKYKAQRCLLHALKLTFVHPITSKLIEIKADLPQDITVFRDKICENARSKG